MGLYGKQGEKVEEGEREKKTKVVVGVRGWRRRGGGRIGEEKCRLKICGHPSAEGASARKLGLGENNMSRRG